MTAAASPVGVEPAQARSTTAIPIDRSGRPARGLRVTIVAVNTFEFDSRFLRSALTLAEDGHDVTILALAGPGLAASEEIAPRVRLVRLDIDQRVSSALRPLPEPMRAAICRALGLDLTVSVLPADEPRGVDRLRHPFRRLLESTSRASGGRVRGPMRSSARLRGPRCSTASRS